MYSIITFVARFFKIGFFLTILFSLSALSSGLQSSNQHTPSSVGGHHVPHHAIRPMIPAENIAQELNIPARSSNADQRLQPMQILNTFVVTNTNDAGDGSLRKAIDTANKTIGPDLISFYLLGNTTIHLLSPLPIILDTVIIDGTTQPGYAGKPIVQIDGSNAGNNADGFMIWASNCAIRGLAITGFHGTLVVTPDSLIHNGEGITIQNGNHNLIEGNYIGVDTSGLARKGNDFGIAIFGTSTGNVIGGLSSAAQNRICGNKYSGIYISPDNVGGNTIEGNLIGVTLEGTTYTDTLGNGDCGVFIEGPNDTVGGVTAGSRNLISGNYGVGITLDSRASGNIISGNYIGTDVLGRRDVKNWEGGIWIDSVANNLIAGNLITGNNGAAIYIQHAGAAGNRVVGNIIGPNFNYTSQVGNYDGIVIDSAFSNTIGGTLAIESNIISGNTGYGIYMCNSASGNIIQGNTIGPGPAGDQTYWGNGADGILIIGLNNTIGGESLDACNIIAYNKGAGIFDSTGKNRIQRNSIHDNAGLGIDIAPRGHTPRDVQIIPILDSLAIYTPDSVHIYGRMKGDPNIEYTLEFFKSDHDNVSHFGEGQSFIGTGSVYCDVNGNGEINVHLSANVTQQQFITATATSKPAGTTTEFSRALCMLDSDGDGILDIWESPGNGIDWNSDGVIDLDLFSKGASPYHEDVFVEVHFMDGCRPDPAALSNVQMAFAGVENKYVNNLDGVPGINLHIDFDPTETPIPMVAWDVVPWQQYFDTKSTHRGMSYELASWNAANILQAKNLVYRYCMFAHHFGTENVSGMAYWTNGHVGRASSDFFISLGQGFHGPGGNRMEQSGTFMHELGHTLGLQHGGSDGIRWKPNYYSVMNYLFQVDQDLQPGTWTLNYSPVELYALDESHLDEQAGLGAQPGDYPEVKIPYARPDGSIALTLLKPNMPVNFDGDADSSGFSKKSVNVNNIDPNDKQKPDEVLYGYADWPNLQFNFRNVQTPFGTNQLRKRMDDSTEEEMTPEIEQYLRTLPPYGLVQPLNRWSVDPTVNIPIATDPMINEEAVITTDGHGGAIIAWAHGNQGCCWQGGYSYGDGWSIYAQRLDSLGSIQWMSNGVPVSMGTLRSDSGTMVTDNAQRPVITDDGLGGAIIVWVDGRVGGGKGCLTAQRIDEYGRKLWATGGVQVSPIYNTAYYWVIPAITRDGNGGAVIVWTCANGGLFAQRIDASGNLRWGSGGVQIAASTYPMASVVDQSSRSGATIVIWQDNSQHTPACPLYAQRIDSSGALTWTPGGVRVASATSSGTTIIDDARGGAIIAWTDFRTSTSFGVYAQRVDSLGQIQWTQDGIPIDTGFTRTAMWGSPQLVSDNSGGAIVAWSTDREQVQFYTSMYAQRISPSGSLLWNPQGVKILDSLDNSGIIAPVISDHAGGAIIVYSTNILHYPIENLFAQRIDSTGIVRWQYDGLPVTTRIISSISPVTVSDNAGGAIVAWDDQYSVKIYAQNVNQYGGLGNQLPTGVRNPQGTLPEKYLLSQNYPNPFNPMTRIDYQIPVASHVSLIVYNILGQKVAMLLNEVQTPGYRTVYWNAQHLASGVYFYRLEATSVADPGKTFTSVKKMILVK